MPTEFVRIRDTKTNTELSVSRQRAEQLAGRGDVEILKDAKAVDGLGQPLPAITPQTITSAKSKEQTR